MSSRPFPLTAISDTFTRADQDPLGGEWSVFGGAGLVTAKVLSNQVANSSASYVYAGAYIAKDFSNCEIYTTVATPDGTGVVSGLKLRLTDPVTHSFESVSDPSNNCYFLETNATGVWNIQRIDAGVITTIAPFSVPATVAGDKIGFRAIGPILSAWRNTGSGWGLVGTATDTTYTHGAIGFVFNGPVVRLDDFGWGEVPQYLYWTRAKARRGRRFPTLAK